MYFEKTRTDIPFYKFFEPGERIQLKHGCHLEENQGIKESRNQGIKESRNQGIKESSEMKIACTMKLNHKQIRMTDRLYKMGCVYPIAKETTETATHGNSSRAHKH